MKNFKLYSAFAVLLVLALSVSVSAAPNIFGISGLLEMPDDTVVAPGGVSLGYHGVLDVGGDNLNFFTGTVGLTTGLEVGIGYGFGESDSRSFDGDDNGFLINAKYRLLAETATRPSFTIGVVDLLEQITDDPGFFLVIGKTLTGTAEDITKAESKPLRGFIGFGSGVYEGLLAGLAWTLDPKFQVGVEYIGEGLENGDFNGYVRYALSRELRLDAGLIDFEDFTFGISYTTLKF